MQSAENEEPKKPGQLTESTGVFSNITYAERGYLSEKERFRGTFSQQEQQRKQHLLIRKQKEIDNRRELLANIAKERRKNEMISEKRRMERMKYLQAKGSPKNESSVPYDPLTLQYNDSTAGRKLKFHDDKIKYRAEMRARKLYHEQNRNGYNPVTGESLYQRSLPAQPIAPKD